MDIIRELPGNIRDIGLGPIPSEFEIVPKKPKIEHKKIQKTRVFTGIISQGTFGEIIQFAPRKTDLISSADELKTAAKNNLALFIEALPGRMIFEIKTVAKVVLKDGTIRTGATQTINTGKNENGSPKTRTITSRFAIANIYVFTNKNKRSLIDTIILGPVDIGKYNPQQNSLNILAQDLKTNLPITSVQEILKIQTPNPIIPATPAPAQIAPPVTPAPAQIAPPVTAPPPTIEKIERISALELQQGLSGGDLTQISPGIYKNKFGTLFSLNPPTITAPIVLKGWNFNAQTLYEWFTSAGQTLPTVDARGRLYEALGLGIANLYTGTAEQNIKLLAELKSIESHIM